MVATDEVSVDDIDSEAALLMRETWLPGLVTATVLVTFQVKTAEFEALVLSVAVMVTEQAHAVVGVPVTAPFEELIPRPVGRPLTVQVSVGVGTVWVSAATGVKVEMAEPETVVLVPGFVTATVLEMFQVKFTELANGVGEPLSVAVMVTEQAHAVVGVPVMAPPDEAIDRPAGRPVAVQVSVAVDEVSVAAGVRVVMAAPDALDLVPGLVTATVLVMVQVKLTELANGVGEPLSAAVMVTEQAHAVVGVPLITPVPDAMVTPAGRPVADQVTVDVDEVSVATEVMLVMAVPDTLDLAVVVGLLTATVLEMFQVKMAELANVVGEPLSVAVIVTEQAHAVVGVPVMAPPDDAMTSPTGRPVAVQVSVATDEVSVAAGVRVVMAAPETLDFVPGLVTVTVLVMVQVKATAFE